MDRGVGGRTEAERNGLMKGRREAEKIQYVFT